MSDHSRFLTSCQWWRSQTLAAIVATALTLPAVAPGSVAIAQSTEHEGVEPPDATGPDAATPDLDLGADTGEAVDVEGAPVDDTGDDSAPPVDVPLDMNEDVPLNLAPGTGPQQQPVAPDDAKTVAPNAEPTPPAEPSPPPTPTLPSPTAATPPPADPAPTANSPATHREKRATARKPRRDRPRHRRPAGAAAPVVTPAPAPVAAAPIETTTTVEPVTEVTSPAPQNPVRPGEASHTVQPGESLWMIASDLLGARATDAQIAAETDRLYHLNRDRIGDDPNMLIAGTVLRLH